MSNQKGRQRQGKFYFDNEIEVMESLGLKPTPGSGSGWMHKEDGENDFVLAQLKSTDKRSQSIKLLDLEKLEYNASVANKIPMFIVQFLSNNSRYALVNIDDIPDIAKYIKFGEVELEQSDFVETITSTYDGEFIGDKKLVVDKPQIKSSFKAREQYEKEQAEKWEERKWRT